MRDDTRAEQRFTEKQVSAILRRAVEMQSARGDADLSANSSAGFSLAQLQQAAAELGIDPHLVAEAVSEVDVSGQPGGRSSIWGGPGTVTIERTVEGTLVEEEWPVLLEEIRRATSLVGKTERVGQSFEWQGQGIDQFVHVTLLPQGEQTRIHVMSRHTDWGVAFHVVSFTAAFITSLASTAILGWPAISELALSAGLFGGLFGAARLGFDALCRRKGREAKALMRAVEEFLARPDRPGVRTPTTVTASEASAAIVLQRVRQSNG